ncbi:uncharacterized protein LOC110233470 [Exaiptasia diaphana]|uniref:Uncharacterized protein n=1 Tax=Exaiptasia diaphana TaxID=2652724 RepID=A0A913WUQ5_EXADI|nr:uncharacterized protein LOC110233470 [Exaiptasia diaphana]KXJ17697.1 hypothetical protein AC249_AIPGENE26873 [Exaiptasia diaphana]
MASSESIIMTLLEQVRCLEEERDKALELSNKLNEKLRAKEEGKEAAKSSKTSDELNFKETLETLADELEEIRLNEEQRQFNISEISKDQDGQSKSTSVSGSKDSVMLELCKQYYGKMVTELQEERNVLQQKVEKLQNEIIEKDMKIAELQLGKV